MYLNDGTETTRGVNAIAANDLAREALGLVSLPQGAGAGIPRSFGQKKPASRGLRKVDTSKILKRKTTGVATGKIIKPQTTVIRTTTTPPIYRPVSTRTNGTTRLPVSRPILTIPARRPPQIGTGIGTPTPRIVATPPIVATPAIVATPPIVTTPPGGGRMTIAVPRPTTQTPPFVPPPFELWLDGTYRREKLIKDDDEK